MDKTPERRLWDFFAEFYDDHIMCGSSGRVTMTARTARVARNSFGRELFERYLGIWQSEGSIKTLGDMDALGADDAYIKFFDYVSEEEKADAS
jgi:hypothetical protein